MTPIQTSARRRFLGLLAAAPAVIALPATATALPIGNPDAEILELERQRVIAAAAYERIAASADELHTQGRAMFPAKPEALRVRAGDWFTVHSNRDAGGFMDYATVERWRAALDLQASDPRHFDLIPLQRDRMTARGREILAAADAHAEACEAVYVSTGARHASDLCDAACTVLGDLEDRILEAPATTAEGLAIKARMVAHIMGDEPDGTREDFAARRLLADLLRDG